MAEYIDRDAIKFWEHTFTQQCHNDIWEEKIPIAYKSDIDKIPPADVVPRNQWISVADAMPEPGATVIAALSGGTVEPLWQRWKEDLNKDALEYVTDLGTLKTERVTHWMPLPEPPRMDGDTHG